MRSIEIDVPRLTDPSRMADAKRVHAVLSRAGYLITLADAIAIWRTYSRSMSGSWVTVPGNDEELLERAQMVINDIDMDC